MLLLARRELTNIVRRQPAILAFNAQLLGNLPNLGSGPRMASRRLLGAILAVLLGNLQKAVV